jgi:hypothetical protein
MDFEGGDHMIFQGTYLPKIYPERPRIKNGNRSEISRSAGRDLCQKLSNMRLDF